MGKDNKALYLVGGAVIAYLLVPKDVKDKVAGAINIQLPEFGGYDFSNLLGGITQAGGGLIPAIEMPDLDISKLIAGIPQVIPEATLPNIEELIRGVLPIPEGAKEGVTPTQAITPTGTSPWDWFTGLNPVVQNIAALTATLGLGYGGVKGIGAVAPGVQTAVSRGAIGFGDMLTRFFGKWVKPSTVKAITRTAPKVSPLRIGMAGGLIGGGAVAIGAILDRVFGITERLTPPGYELAGMGVFLPTISARYPSIIPAIPEGEWGVFTPSTPAIPEGEYGGYGVGEGYASPSGYAAATYGWAEGMGF